jgi:6-phosphogluconolactonase
MSEQTAPTLHVLDDPAAAVAELLAAEATRGGTIVLTGGSRVGRAYELAAQHQPEWGDAAVWWGDERCVPPDDERSNYGLARRTLLDRLARLPDVHRIRGEVAPASAAAEYEEALSGIVLDLLLLGLGPDGHIASLFPGSPQLAERSHLVTDGPPGLDPRVHRVTLTLPALLSARRVVLLVTGADKAEAVQRAFLAEVSEDVPASLLRTGPAPIDVYLDAAAATRAEAPATGESTATGRA